MFTAVTSEPYVRTLEATEDWELLQCEVRGAFPKPQLQWQDSSRNQLPAEEPQVSYRDGLYHITLNITVTKSDRYRCVVTQEELKHQTHAETSVHISGEIYVFTKIFRHPLKKYIFLVVVYDSAVPDMQLHLTVCDVLCVSEKVCEWCIRFGSFRCHDNSSSACRGKVHHNTLH